MIVTMTFIFLLTLVFAPRYGMLADWIRKTNSVPQEVMEDVLGAMLREGGTAIPINNRLMPSPLLRRARPGATAGNELVAVPLSTSRERR